MTPAFLPQVRRLASAFPLHFHPVLNRDDLMQEALLASLRSRHSLWGAMQDAVRAFDPFLWYRRHGGEARIGVLRAEMMRSQTPEPASMPDVLALCHLRRCVAALPERQQAVLHGRYWHELTLAEIGRGLHVGEARASQLHGEAITTLRAMFGEKE